jgi:hypothetical protein
MLDDLGPLAIPPFNDAVDQLEKLLSQSKRAFLIGAGCSYCAGLPLMTGMTQEVLNNPDVSDNTKQLLNLLVDQFAGAHCPTIEDYLSELVDLLSIAERRSSRGVTDCSVDIGGTRFANDQLTDAIDEIKQAIAACINGKSIDIAAHRKFIQAVHSTLQSGKGLEGRSVDYYILNYDTLIEDALALERQSLTDGFLGGVTGWWDQSSFLGDGFAARVFKIHGSIDWCVLDGEVLPRRLRPCVAAKTSNKHVMIWPAATKYRETQRDPYAQMMNYMRSTLRPSAPSEVVLAICGYSFGDSHINIEIDRALKESQQRLTVVVFTSDEKPSGITEEWLADPTIQDQVRVYAKRGFYHGSDITPSSVDLPWWKFEVVVRLMGGER